MPHSDPPASEQEFVVHQDNAGVRLDRWLADQCADVSRSRLKQLIESRQVSVNQKICVDAAQLVRANDVIVLRLPAKVDIGLMAQEIALDVVFEDAHLIVINKPAGMVVHPAAGNPDHTLVNALLAHCGESLRGIGGEHRPGIVHRLDKETSGLLVAAKTETAMTKLAEQFSEHTIERAYDALVWGVPKKATGIVKGNIARSTSDRKKMAITAKGKFAETHYELMEAFASVAAHVQCRLMTGRTHQIRVHMTSIGHPLIGDKTYGSAPAKVLRGLDGDVAEALKAFPRQALHARLLGFKHPKTGKAVRFERPPPKDISNLLKVLRKLA